MEKNGLQLASIHSFPRFGNKRQFFQTAENTKKVYFYPRVLCDNVPRLDLNGLVRCYSGN
jgi:hypothetical protein